MVKLSILICTINGREEIFNKLYESIQAQLTEDKRNLVEIISLCDNKEITIGAKRNKLLTMARGEYVAFVDDDDTVSDDYVSKILDAIDNGEEPNPDCIGMEGIILWEGSNRLFCHSINFQGWYTGPDAVFYRTPNHLNPVKRRIALQVRFKNISGGEDQDYSKRLRNFLRTENYIEDPIYFYVPSTWKEVNK